MKVEELNKDERMEDARDHSLTEWSLAVKRYTRPISIRISTIISIRPKPPLG